MTYLDKNIMQFFTKEIASSPKIANVGQALGAVTAPITNNLLAPVAAGAIGIYGGVQGLKDIKKTTQFNNSLKVYKNTGLLE